MAQWTCGEFFTFWKWQVVKHNVWPCCRSSDNKQPALSPPHWYDKHVFVFTSFCSLSTQKYPPWIINHVCLLQGASDSLFPSRRGTIHESFCSGLSSWQVRPIVNKSEQVGTIPGGYTFGFNDFVNFSTKTLLWRKIFLLCQIKGRHSRTPFGIDFSIQLHAWFVIKVKISNRCAAGNRGSLKPKAPWTVDLSPIL